jgi:hypothetical protein
MNGCSVTVLANWSALSLPTIPSWPGTHIGWTLLCLASCMRDWWQNGIIILHVMVGMVVKVLLVP